MSFTIFHPVGVALPRDPRVVWGDIAPLKGTEFLAQKSRRGTPNVQKTREKERPPHKSLATISHRLVVASFSSFFKKYFLVGKGFFII